MLHDVRRTPKADRVDVLSQRLNECERQVIMEYLKLHRGNISEAATALGISRKALDRKVDAHDLRGYAAEMRDKAGIRGPR